MKCIIPKIHIIHVFRQLQANHCLESKLDARTKLNTKYRNWTCVRAFTESDKLFNIEKKKSKNKIIVRAIYLPFI